MAARQRAELVLPLSRRIQSITSQEQHVDAEMLCTVDSKMCEKKKLQKLLIGSIIYVTCLYRIRSGLRRLFI